MEVLPLSLHIGGAVYRNYLDGRELDTVDFYRQLREGGILPTTSAINAAEWAAAMEPHLKSGEDILVLAFSSGPQRHLSVGTDCRRGSLSPVSGPQN